MALVVFDPYMSSRPLADALLRAPEGKLIVDHHYYTFSSIFFYTNREALLLNGRFNNLVYGSYAPGAPNVFIDDSQWTKLWLSPERYYLVVTQSAMQRLEKLVGKGQLNVIVSKRRQGASLQSAGAREKPRLVTAAYVFLGIAAIPFIYYGIASVQRVAVFSTAEGRGGSYPSRRPSAS